MAEPLRLGTWDNVMLGVTTPAATPKRVMLGNLVFYNDDLTLNRTTTEYYLLNRQVQINQAAGKDVLSASNTQPVAPVIP